MNLPKRLLVIHGLGGADKSTPLLVDDTYEQMTTLDNWMCNLARQLPKNVF